MMLFIVFNLLFKIGSFKKWIQSGLDTFKFCEHTFFEGFTPVAQANGDKRQRGWLLKIR